MRDERDRGRRDRPPSAAPTPRPGTPGAHRRLLLVVVLVTLQAAGEIAVVVRRYELTVALRTALAILVAAQVALAVAALRRSAGAVLCLYALQLMGIVAAVGADGPLGWRLALAAGACAVVALLASASSAFPPPPLPRGPLP